MSIMRLKAFRENQQLEFNWREHLCNVLEEHFDKSGFVDEDDRKAFFRVFEYVRKERNELEAQLQSEPALLREYIRYLESEAAAGIEEIGDEYDDALDTDREPRVEGIEQGIRRLYGTIESWRERLRALSDGGQRRPRPRLNPFARDEETPPEDLYWEAAQELNAPGALDRHPWLALRTAAEFRDFAASDNAKFLTPDEYEPWEDQTDRDERFHESGLFLCWLMGASKVHPPVPEVVSAWESWTDERSPYRQG